MADKLIVVSTVAGRNRGGVTLKQGANEFELGHFSKAHVQDLLQDPAITVVVGELVTTPAEAAAPAAPAAPAKGAKA
jgi:hypothetical protein